MKDLKTRDAILQINQSISFVIDNDLWKMTSKSRWPQSLDSCKPKLRSLTLSEWQRSPLLSNYYSYCQNLCITQTSCSIFSKKKPYQIWIKPGSLHQSNFELCKQHIGCTPPHPLYFCCGGEGGGTEPPTKFFKKGGLTGSQFSEGSYWERGGWVFQMITVFTWKKKKKKENIKYLKIK